MDPGSRTDPAPDQDADRGSGPRRLRLSRLAFLRGPEMAAQKESSEVAGQTAAAHRADQWEKPARDHREGEPHPAGMVRLLPHQLSHGPEWSGRMVATAL